MANNEQYVIIPGTQQKIYEGSVVVLFRLPNLKWIIHNGYYNYAGKRRKGWYFSSIPADTEMPVFNEDLVRLRVVDSPQPEPGPFPPGPFPPGPIPPGPIPPVPPAPIPTPFTPADRKQLEQSMITLETLADRDKFSGDWLINGKIVRVNDIDGQGTVEYYSWNSATSSWDEASLGYRYMTRQEIATAIGDDIISIVWSNEHGALVLTNNAGTEIQPVQLSGVAHDPIYTEETLTLRIPIYGKPDFVMSIPQDYYIRSIRVELEWHFDDHHVGPAIVVEVSDGVTTHEIAGDASALVNIYTGQETATTSVIIDSETGHVKADVKLSSLADNPLKVDNEGLWVDLSGVVGKKEINTGFLLVADGHGEFTYAGDGIEVETTTAIADLTNPEKKVVTANLISDAISAAINALSIVVDERIAGIENRVEVLENSISTIEQAAVTAQAAAEEAQQSAQAAQSSAETATEVASQAQQTAAEAIQKAEAVESLAEQAQQSAEAAQQSAETAQTSAEAAQTASEAAVTAVGEMQDSVTTLQQIVDFGEGSDNEILVTSSDNIVRSSYKIGNETLSDANDTVATEEAVRKVVTWQNFNN